MSERLFYLPPNNDENHYKKRQFLFTIVKHLILVSTDLTSAQVRNEAKIFCPTLSDESVEAIVTWYKKKIRNKTTNVELPNDSDTSLSDALENYARKAWN